MSTSEYNPAAHILQWAENSAAHFQLLQSLATFPRDKNFTTASAMKAATTANSVYRAMRIGGDCEDMTPEDILQAALLMLAWRDPERENEQ